MRSKPKGPKLSHELKVPEHIAIIPDGNRRYAKREGISEAEAHALGAERVNNCC